MSNNLFVCYWISQKSPNTLDLMPKGVDIVPLAFLNIKNNANSYVLDFRTFLEIYPADQIKGWIKTVQANGTKVLFSINDGQLGNIPTDAQPGFVTNVVQNVKEWGVDGLDFDFEDGTIMENNGVTKSLIPIVQALRKELGPNYIFSAPIYNLWENEGQGENLYTLSQSLDYVFSMDYTPVWSFESTVDQCGVYARWLGGWEKLLIGINAYGPATAGNVTPLDDIPKFCKYQAANTGPKAGIMFYTWTYDVKSLYIPGQGDDHGTGQPTGTYSKTIRENLD